MTTKVEVGRVEDFDEGDFTCLGCGKVFTLYYNGGELDSNECCGYTYRTEHQGTDLVIYHRPFLEGTP